MQSDLQFLPSSWHHHTHFHFSKLKDVYFLSISHVYFIKIHIKRRSLHHSPESTSTHTLIQVTSQSSHRLLTMTPIYAQYPSALKLVHVKECLQLNHLGIQAILPQTRHSNLHHSPPLPVLSLPLIRLWMHLLYFLVSQRGKRTYVKVSHCAASSNYVSQNAARRDPTTSISSCPVMLFT